MVSQAKVNPAPAAKFRRVIGSYGGETAGPLVICIGGIHGNEPAGAVALGRVLGRLHETAPPFRGRLLALAGNVGALNRGCRYQQRDLNRMWAPARVAELKAARHAAPAEPEEREQRDLLAIIDAELALPSGPVIVLDLHTTSSDGAPFAILSDTLTNRRLALELGVPVILGLEENIEGTILNYINELGHAAIGFEAGQHDAESSIQHHEATVWLTLLQAGCLQPHHAPDRAALRESLQRAAAGLPPVFELRYRHGIEFADEFVMQPGFTNFHPVTRDQPLASDRRGTVRAPEAGYLFMPLYQKLGDDGFFLIRKVDPFWLRVSAWLRRARLDRALPWLPGIHRLPGSSDALLIDTRIAHWFVIEVCHLLGFRKHSQTPGNLIVTRRRQA
ncbi:MAG: succinylglutamate desuccinylase/aspartoacylase family protein [Blastocatellia bacterium]|nr:succinylglutamate desuccinylase/aspartoacylase family protein [Blastocatellia bacterium]